MKLHKTPIIITTIPICLMIGCLACRYFQEYEFDKPDSNRVSLGLVSNLLISYHNKYGQYPQGTDLQISRTLLSEFKGTMAPSINSRINDEGSLTDASGNPIQFHTSEKLGVYLTSAGENKVLGDKDDAHVYNQIDVNPNLRINDLAKQWEEELASQQN